MDNANELPEWIERLIKQWETPKRPRWNMTNRDYLAQGGRAECAKQLREAAAAATRQAAESAVMVRDVVDAAITLLPKLLEGRDATDVRVEEVQAPETGREWRVCLSYVECGERRLHTVGVTPASGPLAPY